MSLEDTFISTWEAKARSTPCACPYFHTKAVQYLSQKEAVDDKSMKAVRYFTGFNCPRAQSGPTCIKMTTVHPEVSEFNQIYTNQHVGTG